MRTRRKALSAVYGFIVIFTLLMAGIGTTLSIMDSQASVWNAQDRARQLEATRQVEHLALSLNGTSLTVANVGLIASRPLFLYQRGAASSKDSRIGGSLQEGSSVTLPVVPGMLGFAVITSLGNVFWLYNSTQVPAQASVPLTFDASGLDPSYASATLLTVDSVPYSYSSLPKTFDWSPNSVHTYSYAQSFATAAGERVGWEYARGVSSAMAGTVTASLPGSVVSYYSLQYLLSVTGGNGVRFVGSPSGDGWYAAGSDAQVSSNYTWNSVQGQSRQNLASFSLDGSTPAAVPRSGTGSYSSPPISMNSPHTLAFASTTQYHLSLSESTSLAPGASDTFNWGYTVATSSPQWLSNPGFESGSLSPWVQRYGTSGVESSLVHSGTYAGYILTSASYGPLGNRVCCRGEILQSTSIPSGATLTSYTLSVWYYLPTPNPDQVTLDLSGVETAVAGTTVGAWTQLTNSWTGSATGITAISMDLDARSSGSNFDYVYLDDAVASYTYVTSSGGSATATGSVSVSGGVVNYSYPFSYSFPLGAYARGFTMAFPSTETARAVLLGGSSQAAPLPPSAYSLSGSTVTIPDLTIASYGSSFVLVTTASGSYSASQSGSQTGDGWYDPGSSATLVATATAPFSFSSWTGPSTVASPSQTTTSVLMNSYYAVVGSFQISQ
ncbi:MAG: hypothetical protein LYZ66_06280 [Nitrososphaerales archaeon]|nr:hypothetical protein [Nitrososphaerales archaeon]